MVVINQETKQKKTNNIEIKSISHMGGIQSMKMVLGL